MVYSELTEDMYKRIPEVYRTEDGNQTPVEPLKKFMSGVSDQAGDVAVLHERFYFETEDSGGEPGETSDLVNPATADAAWLPWLAQMVGAARAVRGLDPTATRLALATPGHTAGSKDAIIAAAKTVLTGDKFINVYSRTTDVSALGAAGQWDVLIVTRASETLSNPATAVIAAGAKPAGIVLWHKSFETTWDDLEAAFPTWADIDAAPDWTAIEEAGL